MKSIYLFFILALSSLTVFAQQNRKLTGKVTDQESGEPLIGVSISNKDANFGGVSDINGNFDINVPIEGSTTLIFRYIGYEEQEVVVTQQASIAVSLKQSNQTLNEVVLIGYGQVARKDITGSVGTVSVEDMNKAPVRSFEEALAGRVAGVQVSSESGQPGAGVNIVIRGASSLTQDNSPLWVIDGFPLEDPNNNAINPADIESMEILKDASATAIYGARGANGVILITTKQGKIGKPNLSYSGYYGFQETINRIDLMGPYEFVRLQNDIDSVGILMNYFREGKTLDDYKSEEGTDWQDKLLRTAPMQNHSLSLSGGSEGTTYFLSGNILGQDGVIINSGFRRNQARVRIDQTINPKLKVGTNITYNSNKTFGTSPSAPEATSSAMNYLMYSVWGYRPITFGGIELDEMLIDPDVNGSNDYRVNPILSAENELRQNFSNDFNGNVYGEYQIRKDLRLRVTGGINRRNQRQETFNNSQTRYGYFRSTDKVNGAVLYTDVSTWLNENTLTYNKKINKDHTLNVVGGLTFQGSDYNRYGVKAIQLPNESLGLSGLDEGVQQPVTAVVSKWGAASFLSRVNWNYKGKYLLTASFRADGSSKFREDNRWGYFPSGAFAWRAINENFMKKLDFISDAKVRVSWGLTGNNRVSDFATYSQLSFDNSSGIYNAYYAFNNSLIQGVYPTALANLGLRWESTSQANVGLDLGFFNQRLMLTADYYEKRTNDLLLNAQLPGSTGYESAFKNIGETSNTGLELGLTSVIVDKENFGWTSSFNISFNKNKVLSLTNNQESLLSNVRWDQNYRTIPAYISKIGQPLGQMYGYIWEGVYQREDFDTLPNGAYLLKDLVTDNGNDRSRIQPGDIKYRDLNGDGTVNDNDRTVIGRGYPIHQGGFGNNIRYKQFDLNVFFQWSYGNDILNANRILFESGNRVNLNQYATFENRWTPENTNTSMARVGGEGPNAYSSRIVEDGSYLRLKTVSLGYNFTPDLLKRANVKNLRVYVSSQNIFTWTNYSGYDPEVAVYYSGITPGFDYSSYPRPSTLVFGFNISL